MNSAIARVSRSGKEKRKKNSGSYTMSVERDCSGMYWLY
jgi:hypothetical protein